MGIKKAFRFCLPYILVYILILTATTVIKLLLNVVNKNIVNELTANIGAGTLSTVFVVLVVVYMVLYFIERASGFLGAFGTNFFRLNVDELFQKMFMWKSYNTPQENFFNSSFMQTYYFAVYNVSKIRSFIGSLSELIFFQYFKCHRYIDFICRIRTVPDYLSGGSGGCFVFGEQIHIQ